MRGLVNEQRTRRQMLRAARCHEPKFSSLCDACVKSKLTQAFVARAAACGMLDSNRVAGDRITAVLWGFDF